MEQIGLRGDEKILLIQLRKLGDVILSTPLIEAIKIKYPKSKVYFMVESNYLEVVKDNPFLDGVIVRNFDSSLLEEIKLWRKIAQHKFDVVIDILHNPRTAYYVFFSGAKWRIAFQNPARRIFYNVNVPWENRGYSVFVRFELLEPLGIEGKNTNLCFPLPTVAKEKVDNLLSKWGLGREDFLITFDVTSVWEVRRWPKEYFACLADLLAEEFNARIVFTFGPGEEEYVKQTISLTKKRHCLSPSLTLKEFGALIARANLHIGTDSAPKYIAFSQKTPNFTIYGSSDPKNWSPPGNHPWIGWIQKGLPCQPCEARECGEKIKYRCLAELKPEEVFTAVKVFWKNVKNFQSQIHKTSGIPQ